MRWIVNQLNRFNLILCPKKLKRPPAKQKTNYNYCNNNVIEIIQLPLNNFSTISSQLGIPLWLFMVILLWSVIWKLLAFWKSARKGHVIWFIAFAIINTLGIIEILYIYIFSNIKLSKHPVKSKRRNKRR